MPATSARQLAIKIWNYMGAELDYVALPHLVDLFEVDDVDALLLDLVVIRTWRNKKDADDAARGSP